MKISTKVLTASAVDLRKRFNMKGILSYLGMESRKMPYAGLRVRHWLVFKVIKFLLAQSESAEIANNVITLIGDIKFSDSKGHISNPHHTRTTVAVDW